jgi:signal transduction histidine kinase
LAARLSLNLALVHGQVTPIWPPTGIALVAFLVIGRRVWPAIALAAFAVNLPLGPSPLAAAGIAVGNTLAPLIAAELLRRVGFHRQLDRLRDALAITFLGALVGMAISASVGTSVLVVSGSVPASQFGSTWAVWWTGDAMGVLLVAPFLLSLLTFPSPPWLTARAGFELFGLLLATAAVTYLLFLNDLRLEYLVLPLIMAAAWRFRLRGAAPAALIASGVAVFCAVKGLGPFAEETLFEKMVTLQVFNVSLALASFVLASFVETREREEETARLYASARAANEAKTRFLHLAAHELRTPLTVLTGYLSMLADGSLGADPARWKSALDVLSSKTKELNRLVGDLLEASRIEANAPSGNRAHIDLRQVVADAKERAWPRARLLGAEIELDPTADPVFVEADSDQLGRVLDNLINNALTYAIDNPRLTITVAAEDGRAVLRVTDNGIGIAADEHERVFDQFHRSNNPAFANVPGTGLGLYISRQLAQVNGATLVVERSAAGVGSVFALALPLAAPRVTTAAVEAADAALAAALEQPRASLTSR